MGANQDVPEAAALEALSVSAVPTDEAL